MKEQSKENSPPPKETKNKRIEKNHGSIGIDSSARGVLFTKLLKLQKFNQKNSRTFELGIWTKPSFLMFFNIARVHTSKTFSILEDRIMPGYSKIRHVSYYFIYCLLFFLFIIYLLLIYYVLAIVLFFFFSLSLKSFWKSVSHSKQTGTLGDKSINTPLDTVLPVGAKCSFPPQPYKYK